MCARCSIAGCAPTLARVLPDDGLLRWALRLARLARPLAGLLAACGLEPVAAMLRLAPARLPAGAGSPPARRVVAAEGERRGRVALLAGCVGPVIKPAINEAAIRVLTRHGIEVVLAQGQGCCGSLVHHMGREQDALAAARRNIDAWTREIAGARPRRHPDHRVGLRHHGEGLWLHAAR